MERKLITVAIFLATAFFAGNLFLKHLLAEKPHDRNGQP
jgi:hypothetical protein